MLLLLESHPVVAGFVVARSLRQQLFKTSSSNTTALRKRPLSLLFDKTPLFSADNGTKQIAIRRMILMDLIHSHRDRKYYRPRVGLVYSRITNGYGSVLLLRRVVGSHHDK